MLSGESAYRWAAIRAELIKHCLLTLNEYTGLFVCKRAVTVKAFEGINHEQDI